MASVENLDDLPMTLLETLLKQCLEQRPDISGSVLSAEELRDYSLWLIHTYGHLHGKVTQEMLPFFTPDNEMTAIAAEIASEPSSRKSLTRLSAQLGRQDDHGYIAPGREISVGRMLRYYPAGWHTATYFTLFYCFSGSCPVHFKDEVITLSRGDVLIVAPGVIHASPCEADDSVLVFYMIRTSTFRHVFWEQIGEDNLLSKFFRLALESEQATSYLNFTTDDDPEIRRLMLQIYKEHQEDGPYARPMVSSLLRLFFLLLLRRYEGSARLPRTEYFFWKHQFSAILSYIQTHYQHATLQDVADRFHYSARQVGRIVKDYTGENYGDLVRGMKMKKAAQFLREEHLSSEETAYQVGFSTVNSFYRSFTDYYGMPPGEWVKQWANGDVSQ